MQKGVPVKISEPSKGGLEKKITTHFPVKNEFTYFSVVLTCNFNGKRRWGDPEIFGGLRGGGQKIFTIKMFCISPHLLFKCLWMVPYFWQVKIKWFQPTNFPSYFRPSCKEHLLSYNFIKDFMNHYITYAVLPWKTSKRSIYRAKLQTSVKPLHDVWIRKPN